MDLRDYLYLDLDRLEDYMSLLDPGELQTLREWTREETQSSGSSGVPELGKPREEPSSTRSEDFSERTLNISAKHSFNRLYEKLRDSLVYIDENPAGLRKNAAVQVERYFEPSPVTQMIESLLTLMRMMQSFDSGELHDVETKEALTMMSALFEQDRMDERSIPMVAPEHGGGYSVIFSMERRYVLRKVDDLRGDMTLVGKARRVLKANEELDLLDFLDVLPRSIRRSGRAGSDIREAIVELFTNWPEELGPAIDRNALVVKGPAVIVDPLAVFN